MARRAPCPFSALAACALLLNGAARAQEGGSDLVPALIHPPARSAAAAACQLARLQWLTDTLAAPAQAAESGAAWSAPFAAWVEDWCRARSGLTCHAPDARFQAEADLVAAGCGQPLLLYAYAADLARRERHVECAARLIQAASASGGKSPAYLRCLLAMLQCDEGVNCIGLPEDPRAQLATSVLELLQGPGDRAVIERAVVGMLLGADGRHQILMLAMGGGPTVVQVTAQALGRAPSVGTAWLRESAAAIDAMWTARAPGISLQADNMDAAILQVSRVAADHWAKAWAADPRWPEPAEQLLLCDLDGKDDLHRWLERGLAADAADQSVIDNYLTALFFRGSERLARLAEAALASGRFDTRVPALYLRAMAAADAELRDDPRQRSAWWSEARWKDVQKLVNGYIDALAPDRERCRYWESVRIAAAWRCGKSQLARARARALEGGPDAGVLQLFGIAAPDLVAAP